MVNDLQLPPRLIELMETGRWKRPADVSVLAELTERYEVVVVNDGSRDATASVLATYRVTTDDAGDVAAFERLRRYSRGRTTVPDEDSIN